MVQGQKRPKATTTTKAILCLNLGKDGCLYHHLQPPPPSSPRPSATLPQVSLRSYLILREVDEVKKSYYFIITSNCTLVNINSIFKYSLSPAKFAQSVQMIFYGYSNILQIKKILFFKLRMKQRRDIQWCILLMIYCFFCRMHWKDEEEISIGRFYKQNIYLAAAACTDEETSSGGFFKLYILTAAACTEGESSSGGFFKLYIVAAAA